MSTKFEGTEKYIATEDLRVAVNAALTLERPLLIKGEPGTGKTVLAEEVSAALGMKLITWHIKSTTKAQQGLYEYDAITRLRDSQLGDERVKDPSGSPHFQTCPISVISRPTKGGNNVIMFYFCSHCPEKSGKC